MLTCPKCWISIRGSKAICPLCHAPLGGASSAAETVQKADRTESAFPVYTRRGMSRFSLMRLTTLIAALLFIAFCVVLFAIGPSHHWVLFTLLGITVCWADIMIALTVKANLLRLISIQTYLGMLACFVIDLMTHFHGWSVMWVIPCAFIGLILVLILVAKLSGFHLEDCLLFLGAGIALSLLQLIPVFLGKNRFAWPALISIGLLLALGVTAVVFRSREIRQASGKVFNL